MSHSPRLNRRYAAASVAYLVAFYAATALLPAGASNAVDNLGQLIAPCLAGAACLVAARRDRERRAWRLMAASSFAWAAGQAVWITYEVLLRREVPDVSVGDVGFLSAIPLAWAALLAFRSTKTSTRIRAILDGLIVAGTSLFVAWAAVLGPIVHTTPLSSFAAYVDLAYPVGDLVTLVLVVLAVAQTRPERRPSFAFVTAGLAAMAIADGVFLFSELHNVYATGSFIDGVWVASFLLIGLGAMHAAATQVTDMRTAEPHRRRDMLLYIPAALAVVAAGFEQTLSGTIEPFLIWLGIVIFATVMLRQWLAVRENEDLNRALAAKIRDLETVRNLQDAFVANVSHELRTPVTILVGAAKTLLRPEIRLDAQQRLLAEALDRASSKMSKMVEDLLVSAGLNERISLARSPFDLNESLRATLARFNPADKRVDVRTVSEAVAVGDAEWFEEIIAQLLSNADRFAPDGSRIVVRTFASAEHVHVEVSDQGPGIASSDHEKLFRRFSRLDPEARHSGVGLGLYIARRLAESMGAALTLEDDRGPGATFRVSLSRLPASALPAGSASAV